MDERVEQIRKRLGAPATADEYDFLHYISKADVYYLLERLDEAVRKRDELQSIVDQYEARQ
jgi:hypothetical protein